MSQPITSPPSTRVLRASLWVAIGALIAAAVVCVLWVLLGDDNRIVGKAFLTILLLAAFAGVAILESNLASRRPAWLALTSMLSWVVVLLIGAFLIWMPTADRFGIGAERFFKFVLIVLIIQGALLHARLFLAAYERYQTTFTTVVAYVTVGLVVILAVMLVLPIMTDEIVDYQPLYWRVVVALAILAAVGTALVPLVNALFAPKRAPRPAMPAAYYPAPLPPMAVAPAAQAWPTYADAVTPLPALPDGSPDWNAYYVGPSVQYQPLAQQASAYPTVAPAGQPQVDAVPPQGAPWYQGYPPPPPVPSQQG